MNLARPRGGAGMGTFLLVAALLISLRPSALVAQRARSATEPLSELERAVHLLSRATYGVRPQDVARVMRIGRKAWIDEQLDPESLELELPNAGPIDATITFVYSRERSDSSSPAQLRATRSITMRGVGQRGSHPAFANKLVRAIRSERQLEQVMTDFWLNHFSVYDRKREVDRLVADYEETIRSNVFGSFRDLLAEVARHPAMLIYLDNYLNGAVEPDTIPAPPRSPTGSVNENYARELLELHTVGVDGGYTQSDVTEIARAFTGWSVPVIRTTNPAQAIVPVSGPLAFEYRAEWHDTREKRVLGETLRAGRGIADGEEVLDMLARHPATARHVATKLVRHFVVDDPPADLVDELARVFLATDGDLEAVTRALFTSERFYAPAHYRAKIKRPYEFLVSALRVTGADLGPTGTLVLESELSALRHRPYGEPAPTGYPATADKWVSNGSMLARMNLALGLSKGSLEYMAVLIADAPMRPQPPDEPAVHIDPWVVLTGAARTEDAPHDLFGGFGAGGLAIQAMGLLERIGPGMPTERLQSMIVEDLTKQPAGTDSDALLRRAIALTLGSPEFQRY